MPPLAPLFPWEGAEGILQRCLQHSPRAGYIGFLINNSKIVLFPIFIAPTRFKVRMSLEGIHIAIIDGNVDNITGLLGPGAQIIRTLRPCNTNEAL